MSGGLVALSGLQRVIETTPGTAIATTAIQPILGGWMREMVERQFPEEQRYSLIKGYRNFATKNFVQLSGVTIAPTFTDLSHLGTMFWKGGALAAGGPPKVATGVMSLLTVYTYAFVPTVATDDLVTDTFEVGDNVTNWQLPYVIGNKIELGFSNGGPMTCSMDFLAQRAVAAAKTAELAVVGDEDIIGAKAIGTLDTTTIGTGALAVQFKDYKVSWDNGFSQEFVLNGNLYSAGHHRGGPRGADVEATVLFDSVASTEYTAMFQNTGIGTIRKLRMGVSGSTIAGSTGSVPRKLTIDTYLIWDTAEFDTIDGQRACKFSGHTQYDATATNDWSVTLQHASATVI